MSDHLPVLIVGSGPTGLVMACELLTRGVECRIIDRLEGPVSTSRAFTVHARTLELLNQMGLAETFLKQGHPVHAMEYHFMGKDETPRLDFTQLDSPYNFCLNINQNETEAILRSHLESLGGSIEWSTQLQSLESTDDGIICTLVNRFNEQTSVITADWVVGCDGYYSTVRQYMNIPFDGDEYTGMEMKMMDVEVNGFADNPNSIHYFVTKDHLLLFARLPNTHYRVLISDMGGAQTETVREAFQQVADIHFGGAVIIGEPVWATNFKISRRKVDTFRQGRIFLAGDAAHVNSPAGGQGMNVSMQDAFNLAWKLAAVVKGEASENLLATYELERNPIAAQVLEGTHYLNGIIMAHGKNMEDRIALTQAPGWNRKAVNQIAGISYTYHNPETTTDTPLALAAAVGDRLPYLKLNETTTTYDCIHHPDHTLLLFLNDKTTSEQIREYLITIENLLQKFRIPITTWIITHPLTEIAYNQVITYTPSGSFEDSLYLVRPDGYIAAACPAQNAELLLGVLQPLYNSV